jgi:DNA replication protein DnaC
MSSPRFETFPYGHTLYTFYIPPKFHHCTLNNFDFAGNTHLIKVIKKFVEGDIRGIFFYGSFGVGKTHLLVSLYRVMVYKEDDSTNSNIFYDSLENVIRELQKKEPEYDIDYLCDVGLLFLDDITAPLTLSSTKEMEIFRKIINGRYEGDMRTCFTSNAGFKGLRSEGLHPHAISRLEDMCENVEVKGKDRRRRTVEK